MSVSPRLLGLNTGLLCQPDPFFGLGVDEGGKLLGRLSPRLCPDVR